MIRLVVASQLLLLALPALAQDLPPLPRQRPPAAELTPAAEAPAAIATTVIGAEAPAAPETPAVPLPRARPDNSEPRPVSPDPGEVAPETPPDDKAPISEPAAPPRTYQTACPAVLLGQVEAKLLPPISDAGCGAQSPYEVTGALANGRMVPFTSAATITCEMATALPGWITDVDSYLRARDNTGIESVIVGTSYMCRNVNNAGTGNLSFHAFADALDVTGFKLEDGRTVTVEAAWGGTEAEGSRIIRFAHEAACTHFTTTLGPEANALHHDHLHIDLGCHGKTCTARLCE